MLGENTGALKTKLRFIKKNKIKLQGATQNFYISDAGAKKIGH